jgi:type III restriction enzyme
VSGQIELLTFQVRASQQIVNRYLKLIGDADRPMFTAKRPVPYYQALSALTGAGKTPILADAVSQIRITMPVQPIVLWISKAKAVVDQTFANMEPGGKYNALIEAFTVAYLSDLTPEVIADGDTPVLALATVGTFNQKVKGEGTLTVHKPSQDMHGADSLWGTLTSRKTTSGKRRPLLIVYDEAQNLSDQQTDLLLALDPDAMLVASATMKTPGKLGLLIQRLKQDGWSDDPESDGKDDIRSCLVTAVSSKAVVKAGLVKQQIILGGYTSIPETMIDDMLAAMDVTRQKATDLQAGFEPKAIYVCKTNVSQDDGSTDLASRPFDQRKAPPILIWRYLVEKKGVDPADIAVYCDLKVDRTDNPLPESFKLFSGGEQDFAVFSAGNYKHIIFNLALQEGWDDPACAFAYIDKSMGSGVQVEQIIGRVLRQPGAKHYADPDLNTANFYIRVDNKQEFPKILKSVRAKLGAELPEVQIEGYTDPATRKKASQPPKSVRAVPEIHIDAADVAEPLHDALAGIIDFRHNQQATFGPGELQRVVQMIGDGSKGDVEVLDVPHSNRVSARWLVRREMRMLHPEAVKPIDFDGRFDALVEITSTAASVLRSAAEELVDIFLANAELAFEESNPYVVGSVQVNPAKAKSYKNALHESYDLNPLETDIADAIDESGYDWVRNPENGGYSIPLLDKGDTRNFFPDFLVWKDDLVFAVDPKGGHLLREAAWRKLLDIRDEKGQRRVLVRLISENKWNDQIQKVGPAGYTVWSVVKSTGKLRARNVATIADAVIAALKP